MVRPVELADIYIWGSWGKWLKGMVHDSRKRAYGIDSNRDARFLDLVVYAQRRRELPQICKH